MKKGILLFLVCLITLFCVNSVNAQVWEAVGPEEGVSQGAVNHIRTTVDKDNNYYVSYYDSPDMTGASVIKYTEEEWSYLGDEAGAAAPGIFFTAAGLSVDNNGVVYFIYRDGHWQTGYFAKVKKFENNEWVALPDASGAGITAIISAISSNNELIVATNESSGMLKKYNGTEWVQVGASGFASNFTIFNAITDDEDNIYLCGVGGGQAKVFKNSLNASTDTEWIALGGDIGGATTGDNGTATMDMDSEGNIYVLYTNSTGLNVKKYNGEGWVQVGNENFSPCPARHNWLAIDKFGVPCVVASRWDNEDMLKGFAMRYDSETNTWKSLGHGYFSFGQATATRLFIDQEGDMVITYSDNQYSKLLVRKLNLDKPAPESVTISTGGNPAEITTDDGTLQLYGSILPAGASQKFTWTVTSGANKATVSETGLVTATTSNGTVTVRAAATENPSIYSTIDIVITNQISDVKPTKVTASLDGFSFPGTLFPDILSIGSSTQLVAVAEPEEADQYITWTIVEGTGVVSVDANGLVKGLADGHAKIRATIGGLSDEITVSVFANGCKHQPEWGTWMGFSLAADDFIIESGDKFSLKKVWLGLSNTYGNTTALCQSLDINFLADYNGKPGRVLTSVTGLTPTSQQRLENGLIVVEVILPEAIDFTPGGYWLNPAFTSTDGSVLYWQTSAGNTIGSVGHAGSISSGWGPIPLTSDFDFTIMGTCGTSTKDVRINNVSFDYARITPVKHFSGEKNIVVEVENTGTASASASLSIKKGSDIVGSKAVTLGSNEIQDVAVPVSLGETKAGSLKLDYTFSMGLGDDNPLNDTYTTTIELSDTTFIRDYIVGMEKPEALGSNSMQMSMGNIYTLEVSDVFTSVTVYFHDNDEVDKSKDQIAVMVHELDDDLTLGEIVVEEIMDRGKGLQTLVIRETKLAPGTYFFCIRQLETLSNMSLVCDMSADPTYFFTEGDVVNAADYGNMYVRPNFGYNEKADAGLMNVKVNGVAAALKAGSLTDYEITVGYAETVTVTAEPVHSGASVTGDLEEQTVAIGVNEFTITVTSENESVSRNYKLEVTVESQSIEDVDTGSCKLYPNPATDVVTISSEAAISYIMIYDIAGKRVYETSVDDATEYTVNVKSLNAGVYFARMTVNGKEVVQKFIINK